MVCMKHFVWRDIQRYTSMGALRPFRFIGYVRYGINELGLD